VRRSIALLLTVASACLLTACGHGSRSHSTATPAAQTTRAAPPHVLMSKARALAYARMVNLTGADLPGFTAAPGPQRTTPREKAAERRMLACASGGGLAKPLLSQSSGEFQLKRGLLELGVSSEVSVSVSDRMASSELAALRGSRIASCARSYLDELLAGQRLGGVTVGKVSIQMGTPPAPGTEGGFGWRITAPLGLRGTRLSFYTDILGFVAGTARVTLFSSGAVLPFPAKVQQRLFGLLLARATAAHP